MLKARLLILIALAAVLTGGVFLVSSAINKNKQAETPPVNTPVSQVPPINLPTPKPSPTTSSPSPSPAPKPGSPIGFIGCSNSRDAVQGYRAVGGTRIWNPPTQTTYGGGTVVIWARAIGNPEVKYWKEFDAMFAKNPGTKTIWLSMCTHPPTQESDAANYDAALAILAEVQRRIPGATVYVSALNGFVAPHVCSATGLNGPARAQALAERLVSEGRAKLGPDVGDLISDDQIPSAGATAKNTETINDGCHPTTDKGEPKLGRELLKFFPN